MMSVNSRIEKRIAIKSMVSIGMSNDSIAEKLNCNPKTVSKWRNSDGFIDKPRSGAPKKLNQNTKTFIEAKLKENLGASIRGCWKDLSGMSEESSRDHQLVSPTTIRRYVRSQPWGNTAYKPRVSPILTEKNIADRLYFAQVVKSEGFCDDNSESELRRLHIIYTDESPVPLQVMPNKQNIRFRTANKENIPNIQIPKHPLSIMVCGAISGLGKSKLHIVDPKATITAQYYQDKILPVYFDFSKNENVFPDQELITFMQDGAPAHSQRQSLKIIDEFFPNTWAKGFWPGNSPDLNPIEHIWNDLKLGAFKEPKPQNREELIRRVVDSWENLKESHLVKLSNSLCNRINQVIERNGGRTDY